MKSKILSIVGARPQFIKASMVLKKIIEISITHVMVHTGQHYDSNMSDVFFKELNINPPDFHLGIGSGNHGEQTGKMLIEIEKVLLQEKPNLVIVYGDTNSTLAGALATSKLKIRLAHVEAGLRSFNKHMPEEINRVVTDHISDLLFAPTLNAVENLKKESITQNVFNTGDVMLDIAFEMSKRQKPQEEMILNKYELKKSNYILATIHREDNTNKKKNLLNIIDALKHIAEDGIKVFFPVHPRTKKYIKKYNLLQRDNSKNLVLNEPVSYGDMIVLEKNARVVLTDSGGVQKEAYFFKRPAVIPREETEWVEIVEAGWNILTGAEKQMIIEAILHLWDKDHFETWQNFYGDGNASVKISRIIEEYITSG